MEGWREAGVVVPLLWRGGREADGVVVPLLWRGGREADGVVILHLYGVAFDGDALFALQFHVVQNLRLAFALGDGGGFLQKAVGKGAFTVVDVGYDAEVAYVFHKIVQIQRKDN